MAAAHLLRKAITPGFQSEDYLSAAVKASVDGIAIINLDSTFRFVNEAYSKTYGYEPEEMVGRSWEEFRPPDEILRVREFIRPILRRERYWRGEISGLRKDGTRFPQEVSLTQINFSDDDEGVMCIMRDITQQKKLQERTQIFGTFNKILMESIDYEETLRRGAQLTIPTFADACVITTAGDSSVIEKVSVGANRDLSIFSALLAQLPFKISDLHCHPYVHRTQAYEHIQYVTTEIIEKLFPDPVVRQEFEDLELTSYIVTPLCVRNRFLGAIGFFRTKWRDPRLAGHFDRDDVELAVELASRMALAMDNARLLRESQSAVSAREDLMASVSHDLKSPLTSISVSAEMIAKVARGSLEGQNIIKLSEGIRASVGRMMSLIRELLELERIRGGTFRIDRKLIRTDELVQSVLQVFSSLAKQKNIQVINEHPPKAIWFHADRDRLQQALSNLLENAIRYTPSGGVITVTTELLHGELRLSISDTGQGISKEDLPRIFERYYQAKAPRQKPTFPEGTGLGLAITRAIVEAHGGAIWAQSKLGEGSRFTLTIPL